MSLSKITDDLVADLRPLRFGGPVDCVYNPLEYARDPHEIYLNRYGRGRKRAVLLGMNPGPYGMTQTGVPFGEVSFVRDWMKISGRVAKPAWEHPRRPIDGFACARSEVSGRRVWGWAQERFGEAADFFNVYFVISYCPLAFMEPSGLNRTPDKLPLAERTPLFKACDKALRRMIEELRPNLVVGVGAFAEARAQAALAGVNDLKIGRILHPSPASPLANQGWGKIVTRELKNLGAPVDP